MITPSPTSPIAPTLARGVYLGISPATTARVQCARMGILGTSYDLYLVPTGVISTPVGKRLIGTIRAEARRVDVVQSGGRYVEPVIGRPRRIQGSIIAVDAPSNTIVVDAGIPIHCTLTDPRQRAEGFGIGQFVSFDAMDGATLTPAGP
jgi:hypothetical protein